MKSLTASSRCPTHGTHAIRYCPDAGHVPGKKRGSVLELQQAFIERIKAAHVEPPASTVVEPPAASTPPEPSGEVV